VESRFGSNLGEEVCIGIDSAGCLMIVLISEATK
jgi:hypothetical protein